MMFKNKNDALVTTLSQALEADIQGHSLWYAARVRFMRNRAAVVSVVLLTLITLACIFGPMVLPMALLVFINVATIARVMRGSMIEVLSSNFIRTARAKGLPLRTVVLRHAMKPALLPVVSLIGPLAISSITAAVVTESVFSLPGLGKLIVNGASNRDYTLVLGLVVLITVVTVVFNLLVDLTYALLDPKIRY